jgi:hypothetical protein
VVGYGFSNALCAFTATLVSPRMTDVTFRCRQFHAATKAPTPRYGTKWSRCGYPIMKPTPIISEKKAAVWIWIGAVVFTIGAMIFGH